jgi:hypothetical protein
MFHFCMVQQICVIHTIIILYGCWNLKYFWAPPILKVLKKLNLKGCSKYKRINFYATMHLWNVWEDLKKDVSMVMKKEYWDTERWFFGVIKINWKYFFTKHVKDNFIDWRVFSMNFRDKQMLNCLNILLMRLFHINAFKSNTVSSLFVEQNT